MKNVQRTTGKAASPSPGSGRRLPVPVRRSLLLILLLLVLTQYPVLSWFNNSQPLLWGFPVLFCYLTGVFALFFFLLPALGRNPGKSGKRN